MANDGVSRPAILALTEWGEGGAHNGSHVLARAVLERLGAWFDIHALVPEGCGGGRTLELPRSIGTGEDPSLPVPPVSLIYNFGGTSFSCRAGEWASRALPHVPLVNHFQINLGCCAAHQGLGAADVDALTLDQARAAARAVRNLFPSHSELLLAVESFGPAAADCYVVPNPFVPDEEPDVPDAVARPEALTFLVAGRFSDPVKGADLVYRAFAGLVADGVPARLEIASDSERFVGLLRGLPEGSWVHHGWLPRWRLHARMRAADVVVVPSRYEPFGLVALEALSLGTPVIATGVGGLQEVVHDGVWGWLTSPGDGSRGLREAMRLAVAAGRETLTAMGAAAADAARREHSLDRIAALLRVHLDNARRR